VLAFPLRANVALGAAILVPQKEVAETLYQRGVVNYEELRRLVAQGRVEYLIADAADNLPGAFLGASLSGYVPHHTIAGFAVFVRKNE
jgi:hypothetical protein